MVYWSRATPAAQGGNSTSGAIGAITLRGQTPNALEHAYCKLVGTPFSSSPQNSSLPIGSVRVVTLRDNDTNTPIDRVVIARWCAHFACIMPHGGSMVMHAIESFLSRLGFFPEPSPITDSNWLAQYPEAADIYEARALYTLTHAASARAIDLILDQPRRWREHELGQLNHSDHVLEVDSEVSSHLRRLIHPGLIVAVGASNIGKSSLLNALAGRDAAIVADQPGTTRDHVGVLLNLAGITARFFDTPGVRDDASEIEKDAIEIALAVARSADVLLICEDSASNQETNQLPPSQALATFVRTIKASSVSSSSSSSSPHASSPKVVRVALRSDLATQALIDTQCSDSPVSCAHPASLILVSSKTGAGLELLVARLAHELVPESAFNDPRAWRFWD